MAAASQNREDPAKTRSSGDGLLPSPLARLYRVYNACLTLAFPLFCLYYGLRVFTDGKYRTNYRDRLGFGLPCLPRASSPRIWIHALSAGETLSVVPLVQALKEQEPGASLVFSSATETGRALAESRLAPWVDRFFTLPHDFPWVVRSLVRCVRPDRFVLVETDLWPNLLRELKAHRVPVALVNGRLSPKSFKRLHRFYRFTAPLYGLFDFVFAQSLEDKARFEALAVPARRVHALGNLKFDATPAPLSEPDREMLRQSAGLEKGRSVWIAGSTHPGEEEILLRAHRTLMKRDPELLLILAPRKIERASEIKALCGQLGLTAACRSEAQSCAGRSVYLLDTLGELSRFYGLAQAAFIGGSLVPFGGHNPLEAVAQAIPACWGPHGFNFREIEKHLLEAGCGRTVASQQELEEVLRAWLGDTQRREARKRAARNFLEAHSGCSARIAEMLFRELCKRGEAGQERFSG